MRKPLVLIAVTVLTASFSLTGLAASGDWPQWRGPNRDGCSTEKGLLKQWPKGGPKLVWKADALGRGYAGVSAAGDLLFTMGDKDGANYVMALKRADGKIVWSTKVGRAGAPGWGGFEGPRCTPTVDGNLVFAVAQYGEVVCAEADTGKEVWRKDYAKDFGGRLPEWGYCGMPLVDGVKVILAPGGRRGNLAAVNKTTGEPIWQSKDFTDDLHYSSPVAAEIGGVRQYIQLTGASVAGVAAEDGRLLWRAPRSGPTATVPTPIVHDDTVYVTSGYGAGCNLYKITEDGGKFSVEQRYANKVMTSHHGGVVRIGNHLYGFSDGKGWTCQDLETGKAIWQEKSKLGKGSLIFADGMLYLRSEGGKGTCALVEATPEGYKEHGRFDQPDRSDKNSWPHPVIAGGKLYLRDQDVLLCYDVHEDQ